MSQERPKTRLGKWLEDAAAADLIISKSSAEVADVKETYADGRIVVYGDSKSRATRMEVSLPDGRRVTIHRDYREVPVAGLSLADVRFSRIEVFAANAPAGEAPAKTIRIEIDPRTSPYNPSYHFFDGEEPVGDGYGSRMDLAIAADLLEERGLFPYDSMALPPLVETILEAGK